MKKWMEIEAHVTFLETQKVENAKETQIFHTIELQEQHNMPWIKQ